MEKSKVYITHQITPESLIKIYETLGVYLKGNLGIKISTGEAGSINYLSPELIGPFVQKLNGTIIECNTAYPGKRTNTKNHLKVAEEHGYTKIAKVDIMDSEGEIEIPVNGKHLDVDIVGSHLNDYDSMVNLAHFKGHAMGGFGGVLKNQSIGVASRNGKAYIHSAGTNRNPLTLWFKLPEQDDFVESMAEAAKAVHDYLKGNIVYIDIMNNMSVECDCEAHQKEPVMQDIGILASTDPVALDQACVDLIWNSNDPGKDKMIERIERQHGRHILPYAEEIGLGSRGYDLIDID